MVDANQNQVCSILRSTCTAGIEILLGQFILLVGHVYPIGFHTSENLSFGAGRNFERTRGCCERYWLMRTKINIPTDDVGRRRREQ